MKKYVAEWRGKKIILTEEDYKMLLIRFDIMGFKFEGSYYINQVSCPLCERYLITDCSGCTFNKFHKGNKLGCYRIINQISEEIKTSRCLITLGTNRISFIPKRKRASIKFISHIRSLLITKFQLIGK